MEVFKDYSKYYNLLYKDKDYHAEADYVLSLIQKNSAGSKSILNLGCGTGNHDFIFADKGFQVTGADLSQGMIDIASAKLNNRKDLRFIQGDMRELRLHQNFDVVLSLFHVMSYQTSNADLDAAMKTAGDHLEKGGLFIFDCWYGPGVLTDRPSVRNRNFEDDHYLVTRLSTPQLFANTNCVDVQFDVTILDKATQKNYTIHEIHTMRYLFLPELNYYLDKAGFELLNAEEWLSGKELSYTSWNATLVCRKK